MTAAFVACPACHSRLSPLASACHECGQRIAIGAVPPSRSKTSNIVGSSTVNADKSTSWFAWIAGAIIVLAIMSYFERRAPKTDDRRQPTAFEMMQVVFVGHHSIGQIETQIRRAAKAFGLPETEQHFHKMSSALVGLREQSGVSEMDLLRCAGAMREEVLGTNVGLDFPTAVGMCAASLSY